MRNCHYVSVYVSTSRYNYVPQLLTFVYRLIKSRLQMSEDPSHRNMGTVEYMRQVVKNEGIAGLYKGLDSKLLQSVLSSAFLFYAKEMLFDWSVWALIMLGVRKSMQS